jgi:transposase
MNEASYETLKRPLESALPEQVEIRVRRERRRRWSPAEKLRIIREAFAPGAIAQHVAERYEISTGLLFTWRRQIMASAGVGFLPVKVKANADQAPPPELPALASPNGGIEIDLPNGVRVRLSHGVDLEIVRGLLAALDGR